MIEAVIHVHNRTQYLVRAVEAAVSSAGAVNALVRVSCNASDALALEAARKVAQRYSVNFIHSLATSAFDHFHASVAASSAEHVCLLHDDDFVAPNYFNLMHQLIASNPEAAGYAPDANFLVGQSSRHAALSPKHPFKLSPRWLALLYLMGRCGPPFPCIVYRQDFAAAAFARSPEFAKYSDAVIVLEAARAGLWIHPEPAFTYVIGIHNDSRIIDGHARRQLRYWLLRQMLKGDGPVCPAPLANFEYFLGRFIKSSAVLEPC